MADEVGNYTFYPAEVRCHSHGAISLGFKMSPLGKEFMLMFDLHKNECVGGKYFPLNNFAFKTCVDTGKRERGMADKPLFMK